VSLTSFPSGDHGAGSGPATFPTAFTSQVYIVQLQPLSIPSDTDEADELWAPTGITTSGFTLSVQGDTSSSSFYYFAIGR
jgi:hypothetical protein